MPEKQEFLLPLMNSLGIEQPYRWQIQVFDRLVSNDVPGSIVVPTAAGKTMMLAVFVAALATQARAASTGAGPVTLPRRIVHVVNRRILVDESSRLAQQLADALQNDERLAPVKTALSSLSAIGCPLAVSALRGGALDNGAWTQDPATPSIILATPDMLGSRLLFRGYGLGRSRSATHAGLLSCDTLVIHDEAHLAPAFTTLLREVEKLAAPGALRIDRPPLRVVEMTATLGATGSINPLVCDVSADPALVSRMSAPKRLEIVDAKLASSKVEKPQTAVLDSLVTMALSRRDTGQAVAIFVNTPGVADTVSARLQKSGVEASRILTLTGTMRGHERALLTGTDAFRRFHPGPQRLEGQTAYFIATSAGEIGLDIDADVGLFDLTTLDRFIQRCGRVNRRGLVRGDIHLIHAGGEELPETLRERSQVALDHLQSLPEVDAGLDASPLALSQLCRRETYALAVEPPPAMRELEPSIVQMLSMTSLRLDEIGCPAPQVFIHGLVEEDAQVHLAWRDLPRNGVDLTDWMEAWPLTQGELAKLPIEAARRLLRSRLMDVQEAAASAGETPLAVMLDAQGLPTMSPLLLPGQRVGRWLDGLRAGCTVLLDRAVGGLNAQGLPSPESGDAVSDVSAASAATDELPQARVQRFKVVAQVGDETTCWTAYPDAAGETDEADVAEALGAATTFDALIQQVAQGLEVVFHDAPRQFDSTKWSGVVTAWMSRRALRSSDAGDLAALTVHDRGLQEHLDLTAKAAERVASCLSLPAKWVRSQIRAGAEHDRGKQWTRWQQAIGNHDPAHPLGKSSAPYFNHRINDGYRHELGSLVDRGEQLSALERHLIAAHHGWARPGFRDAALAKPGCGASAERAAREFSILSRELGPWALSYLEAILKAADVLAEVMAPALMVQQLPDALPPEGSGLASDGGSGGGAEFQLEVDPANFGEYLAGLGLAAVLLRRGHDLSMAWGARSLKLIGVDRAAIMDALASLSDAQVEADVAATVAEQRDAAYPPLRLVLRDGSRWPLNHWLDESFRESSRWKLGAGQTTASKTLASLIGSCSRSLNQGELELERLLSIGGRQVGADASKFRFDAATNWSAQDAGFSLNENDAFKSTRPWVELLSAFGLQHFFIPPADASNTYFIWHEPLPAMLALAAVKGLLPQSEQGFVPVIQPNGKMKDVFTSQPHTRERKSACLRLIRVI